LSSQEVFTVADPSRRSQIIERTLREQVDATHVEVLDDSAAHADHLGAQGGGGHFRVLVVSPRFEGLSPVAAQRLVYQALGDFMTTDVHALEMRTLTPEAWHRLQDES
jgi:BolA protein